MVSKENRSSGLLDISEDCLFGPSLRIAPLQDPILIMPSSRPPTLEPNTRLGVVPIISRPKVNHETRHKALAEALPLGELDSDVLHSLNGTDSTLHHAEPVRASRRRRQKLNNNSSRPSNLIQLPKPPEKTKLDKPPPFQPVSVLNELHEPPPSAALFPPITPSVDGYQSVPNQNRPIFRGPTYQNPKRMNLRPRLKWTEQETIALLKGVELFGQGKWKKILNHYSRDFNQERTAVDLKDRYRTCRANGLTNGTCDWSTSAAELKASGEAHSDPDNDLTVISKVSGSVDNRARLVIDGTTCEDKASIDTSATNFTAVNTPHLTSKKRRKRSSRLQATTSPPPDKVRKRKPKNHWTEEEDGYLAEGYHKHGFQWTLITKDPDLGLSHRTGPQVRDRFRLKYPDIYLAPMPIPLLEEAHLNSIPKLLTLPNQQEPITGPTPPGVSLRLQPLTSDPHESSSENGDEIFDSDTSSRNTESRQTTVAPDEVEARHLGIEGLLNEDDEEGPEEGKLPSFKYTYDDWEGDSSMTLPPLLWEHMATRPIFELDEGV